MKNKPSKIIFTVALTGILIFGASFAKAQVNNESYIKALQSLIQVLMQMVQKLQQELSQRLATTALPTPPNSWKTFRDTKLGLEFKVPNNIKVGTYEPPIHSYSDYYSEVQNLRGTAEAQSKANYYYDLYKKAGTTLKIFYNDTGGGDFDKYHNRLLAVVANPFQLSFSDWKNAFEYCDLYNPSIGIYSTDACPNLECICNGFGATNEPAKYEIFQQIAKGGLVIYLGNFENNFAAFLPYKDKVYIVSQANPSIGIPWDNPKPFEEAKKDFLNSDELKILSSIVFSSNPTNK